MQGIHEFIPTDKKVSYINQLLKVGFDTIDFGSFVSPKAIPQMRDTAQVLKGLELDNTSSKLLAIVANLRGAQDAAAFDEITYLGFPLSISETFQQRNTNKSIAEALENVKAIQNLCIQNNKVLVTYISMGFGNPYGDPYSAGLVIDFVHKLKDIEVKIISLADTIGISDRENIQYLFSKLIPGFPYIEFGAHLHSTPDAAKSKIASAFEAGCTRFDGAIRGFGGCPMAKDEMVGNLATETIVSYFTGNNVLLNINKEELAKAMDLASTVFPV